MTSRSEILNALDAHLVTIVEDEFSPAYLLKLARPNITFPDDSPSATPKNYLSISLLMNRGENYELEGPQEILGIFQVSVYWEKGVGLVKPLDVADEIIRRFRDQTLFTDNVRISVSEEPWAATPLMEDDRVQIPVSINFRAETEV